MDDFLNRVKAHVSAMGQGQGQPRLGLVSSVDPTTYTARVLLQPEGVLTGWLPVLAPWVGAGWGLSCPPGIGDQVLVLPQEGEAEHGIIVGRLWSEAAATPGTPVGALWLVHGSGSFLKLNNDGSVEGQAARWSLTGDLHVTGQVVASGDVLAGSISLQGHVHPGVQPGGGTTGTPEG